VELLNKKIIKQWMNQAKKEQVKTKMQVINTKRNTTFRHMPIRHSRGKGPGEERIMLENNGKKIENWQMDLLNSSATK